MKVAKLKVDEARRSDVGRQIARIPATVATELGVRTGDIIQIKGRRVSYAKVWRSSYPEIRPDTIKLEAIIRRNVDVNLDEIVEISPAQGKIAKSVILHPIQRLSIGINLTPYLTRAIIDRVLVEGDIVAINTGFGGILYFRTVETVPSGPVIFTENTNLGISDQEMKIDTQVEKDKPRDSFDTRDILQISYENIGGLDEAIRKVREMIELPLRHPEIFDKLGIQPPKGVLLYGPPGTGKTLLARAIASETSSHFIHLSGPEIMSKYYGESENKLREMFEDAKKNAPSIIFLDEIDSIAPKREDTTGEVERRIVAQLLALMDGLETRGNVVVIGATNRPNSIDQALRRGGRFDREIEIGIPDIESRKDVLGIHTRGMPLDDSVILTDLSNRTHGFVGADLEMLCKEAALSSLHRFLPEIDLSLEAQSLDGETLNKLNVTMDDFEQALTEVSPSALREVFVEVPNVSWNDIGGLDGIKNTLKEAVEWPLKYHQVFQHLKAKAPLGILIYGPPGTGKTMLAKAVAHEANANFISIKGPELLSVWIGESEKGIREVFRKARNATPCIIFFDEIDAIASSRDSSDNQSTKKMVSQLLTEMDGMEEIKGVTVLAASNRPDLIDSALLRPGRFDKVILIGKPDFDTRMKIFDVHLMGINKSEKINIESLATRTENYSGAEIAAVVSVAKMIAIREFVEISIDDEGNYDTDKLTSLILTNIHLDLAFNEITLGTTSDYNHKPSGLSSMGEDFV